MSVYLCILDFAMVLWFMSRTLNDVTINILVCAHIYSLFCSCGFGIEYCTK